MRNKWLHYSNLFRWQDRNGQYSAFFDGRYRVFFGKYVIVIAKRTDWPY